MGRYRNVRKRSTKNKSYSKIYRTRCRPTDLDQIQDNLKTEEEKDSNGEGGQYEIDEDLPGNGQYPCISCGRHFIDQPALEAHLITRVHIRRLVKCTSCVHTMSIYVYISLIWFNLTNVYLYIYIVVYIE